MAVDRGYGSGKPRSATQSASRRAAAGKAASRKETVTAAAKKYGQKKNMMYTNPGMLASQKKRTTLDNRRTSANALEAFTGFNSRDGVDAGDLAGLAISIPTAGIGGVLLRGGARVAKMVIPKAARVAKASTRLSKSAKAAVTANRLQSEYYIKETENAVSDWYSAKALPNPTRGELYDPVSREIRSRANAEKTRRAADAIEQSGRLDPAINADRILGRLEQFKYLKKRRGGR